jgi:3-methylcrotonyl-CoA carboxylase alpha subunit
MAGRIPFRKILVANRGEIACRVMRSCRKLGIATVAVYSDADAQSRHVREADQACRIGPAAARESYLSVARLMEAMAASGADALHPGYGFLSERAELAEACATTGVTFIGPPPSAMRAMGMKDAAKALMTQAGVPVVPGYHGTEQSPARLAAEAEGIGWPVLIKAVAGGGGKGMRRVDEASQFEAALAGAKREAAAAFGDDRVLLERYVSKPRHIEVQVFGDSLGNVIHLFERDCSVQRRHQKVLEEAPAPGMTEALRTAMTQAAITAAHAIGYVGAGTVEFIVDASRGLRADGFYFMEMNTRLQVEHPVTEMILGEDLVEWQIRVAGGARLPKLQHELQLAGHAVEARVYAEDPLRGFLPSPGRLLRLRPPAEDSGLRVDTGVSEGDTVTPHYDPMIAKVVAHGATRDEALTRLASALSRYEIAGVQTNVAFVKRVAEHPAFRRGDVDTAFIERFKGDLLPSKTEVADTVLALAAAHLSSGMNRGTEIDASIYLNRNGVEFGIGVRRIGAGDGRDFMLGLPQREIRVRLRTMRDGYLEAMIDDVEHRAAIVSTDDDVTVIHAGDAVRLRLGRLE